MARFTSLYHINGQWVFTQQHWLPMLEVCKHYSAIPWWRHDSRGTQQLWAFQLLMLSTVCGRLLSLQCVGALVAHHHSKQWWEKISPGSLDLGGSICWETDGDRETCTALGSLPLPISLFTLYFYTVNNLSPHWGGEKRHAHDFLKKITKDRFQTQTQEERSSLEKDLKFRFYHSKWSGWVFRVS